jgi:N-acetylglucosaminyldiphosphoundecaprenol N-acetyl-beta-D-mannosaminyltransferase
LRPTDRSDLTHASSIDILGCRVDAVDRDSAIELIAERAQVADPSIVVTLGVEMVMNAQRDARFRAIVNRAVLSLCDTIGILLASRARGGPLRERVTGVGLIEPLVARSAERGDLRIYLFGGAPGVAERAAIALTHRHPGAQIAGTRDGYFAPGQSVTIAASIASSKANIVLVGLGSPKQESWMDDFLGATKCGVGIGVGGSFDVLAGMVERAPVLWQRLGLEWLHRLIKEPSRWRRQLALPRFALAATREAILNKGRTQR